MVRAGCGEFEGERNVCVDVGLGHGYTETANTKSKEAFLETCIFFTHLEVISAPLRERSREEPEGCARAMAGVGPGGRFDSYNKHIQSLKELTCPSEKPHTTDRLELDRVPRRDHVAPGTPRRPDTYTVSGTLQPIRLSQ